MNQPTSAGPSARSSDVTAEQVRLLYAALPLSLGITLVNATILAFVISSVTPMGNLVGWYLAIWATSVFRAGIWLARHRYPDKRGMRWWRRLHLIGIIAAGSAWGSAGVLLFAADSVPHQAFLALVLAGQIAGAVGSLSFYLPAIHSYMFTTVTPITLQMLSAETLVSNAIGVMALLLTINMSVSARRANITVRNNIELRQRAAEDERKLRLSESRYRQMFVNNGAVLLVIDVASGTILEANPAAAHFYQTAQDELEGSTIWSVTIAPEEEVRALWQAIDGGEITHLEDVHRIADNTTRHVDVYTSPINLDDKQLRYYIVHDVEARRTAELSQLKAEAELRTIATAFEVRDAIAICDADVNIIRINQAFERTFGFSADEVVGHNPRILQSGRHTSAFFAAMWQEINSTNRWEGEIWNRRKSGEIFPAWLSITAVLNRQQQVTHYVGHFTDITERKQQEQELRQTKERAEEANLSKSAFLANMSHEIRTPMNAILGYSQLLGRDTTMSPDQRVKIGAIERSGEHLLGLINDILEMSRIEAGGVQMANKPTDLVALIRDLEEMFQLRCDEKKLALGSIIDARFPKCLLIDSGKVRQILINLLGNAVKFTERGSINVRVGYTQADAQQVWVRIDVVDTGPGIAAADHERIFLPFEQTETGQRNGGTGLGMPISRQYARMLGGDITLRSQVDAGSSFRLLFPAALCDEFNTRAATQFATPNLRVGAEVPQILVVDDYVSNRALLGEILTFAGFDTLLADSGEAAIHICETSPPDLILMDWMMPGMDGLEAFHIIRELPGCADIPVVLVTASAMEEQRQTALSHGIDGFIRKPVDDKELLRTVAQLLDLEYKYRMDDVQSPPPSRNPAFSISPDLRKELIAAIEIGEQSRLLELITQLAQTEPTAAHQLTELAQNYDYKAMLELVNTGEPADE